MDKAIINYFYFVNSTIKGGTRIFEFKIRYTFCMKLQARETEKEKELLNEDQLQVIYNNYIYNKQYNAS